MSQVIHSIRPLVALAIPLVAAVAIVFSRHRPDIREVWTVLAATAQVVIVVTLVPDVLQGHTYSTEFGTLVTDVSFGFQADALGVLFALVASFLWLCTSVYNVGYVRVKHEHKQTRYFAAFAVTLAAVMGVAFAENLLTLFVFYELLTIATYPLVTHKGTETARSAGRTYLFYAFGGGVLAFVGILLVYWLAGTLAFTPGGLDALATVDPVYARVAFVVLAAGFGVKAALVPVHSWLPEAMVAPTPVSGLLHAVAVVKSGVFALTRIVLDVYGPHTLAALDLAFPLALVAAATTLFASILALKQDNLKRLLAYSTVSQLSYIVLGVAVFSGTAITGGLFHIPAHAVMKLGLFLCVGTIYVETRVEEIDGLAGISRRLPMTMTVFVICAAGMVGIPFTAGFVSKWYIVLGSHSAGVTLFAFVLVANGVLKAVYFWPLVYTAFFETPCDHDPLPILAHAIGGRTEADSNGDPFAYDGGRPSRISTKDAYGTTEQITDEHAPIPHSLGEESSWFLLVPLIVLAILTLVLGTAPGALGVFDLARMVATEVVP